LTLLGVELRPLGRPVRSQSLCRLRYRASPCSWEHNDDHIPLQGLRNTREHLSEHPDFQQSFRNRFPNYDVGKAAALLVEALCCKLEGPGFDSDYVNTVFNLPNPSSRTMSLGSIKHLTEMSTRNLPGERDAGG
jgi:hypothetical protein